MSNISFRLRRGPAVDWQARNPILGQGEPGFETDTRSLKIGDGITAWNSLPYTNMGEGSALTQLAAHEADPTPHPAYDDGPSLVLLYENAKV